METEFACADTPHLLYGITLGILDRKMFTMMVCMAIVTTGMADHSLPRRTTTTADSGDVPPAPVGAQPVPVGA
ncbi:hypothetical protein [Streptomyces sp. NPDC050485]|uniref:hypothetical protein n=1 Tax=Streptomyces sp. NPDC050485 TaxID=3365617 RepID=UPI00378AD2FD